MPVDDEFCGSARPGVGLIAVTVAFFVAMFRSIDSTSHTPSAGPIPARVTGEPGRRSVFGAHTPRVAVAAGLPTSQSTSMLSMPVEDTVSPGTGSVNEYFAGDLDISQSSGPM